MKKMHTIPYGYRMVNGNFAIMPDEAEIVKMIFKEYIGGMSYRKLAEKLMAEGYVYYDESGKWSLGAVKKLVFRDCYIGKNGFPRIISDEAYMTAQAISESRRKNKINSTDDNHLLRKITMCGECGRKLERFGAISKGESIAYWRCMNPDCTRLGFSIVDDMIIDALDRAILNAEQYCSQSKTTYGPNSKVIYQQNQINQMLDNDKADYERIKEEIVKLASLKYECISYNCSEKQVSKIAELLAGYTPDSDKRAEFIRECISRITINNEGIFTAELIDGTAISSQIERKKSK